VIALHQLPDVRGASAQDFDGDRVGTVREIYVEERAARAAWVAVETGAGFVLAPAAEATYSDGVVTLPYRRDVVAEAPRWQAGTDDLLPADQEDAAARHYEAARLRAGAYTPHTGTAATTTTAAGTSSPGGRPYGDLSRDTPAGAGSGSGDPGGVPVGDAAADARTSRGPVRRWVPG
jgi:hypothetical protein